MPRCNVCCLNTEYEAPAVNECCGSFYIADLDKEHEIARFELQFMSVSAIMINKDIMNGQILTDYHA